MNISAIKKDIHTLIDEQSAPVLDLVKDIGAHPELGFKEFRTSNIVNDFLNHSGYETKRGLALTGIKTQLKKEHVRPNIAFIAELDGITCSESSRKDKATHNCGHNLQLGVLLSVAQAFKKSGISSVLGGNISFIASPAEEYIELEYRSELRKRGDIRYFGGKQELISRGVFDDVDAAIMVHSQGNTPYPFVGAVNTGNGLIAEMIRYIGKSAHAAVPDEGINALNAAILGINAVNAMRETFRDEDRNRVHFIITKGGDAVNSVPSDVRLECFVRSCNVVSMLQLLEQTEKSFRSGGSALGAKVRFKRLSGYLPLMCNPELNSLFTVNARQHIPENRVKTIDFFKASTDMGDITHLMPAIHPLVGGVDGALHAADFKMVDATAAIITPAKIVASTLIDLLSGNAAKMRSITGNYRPLLTKPVYLDLLDSLFRNN